MNLHSLLLVKFHDKTNICRRKKSNNIVYFMTRKVGSEKRNRNYSKALEGLCVRIYSFPNFASKFLVMNDLIQAISSEAQLSLL